MNSPYKQYYMNYTSFIDQLKELEKTIRQDIASFRLKSGNTDSTLPLQNTIKEKLKQFKDLQNTLSTAYITKNVPSVIPQGTIDERQKEIQQFEINYTEMEKEFRNLESDKYAFKGGITEDYSKKEEYKDMTTQEIMALEKKKLNNQDDQIDDIVLDVKKGKQLAKNAGNVIKEQNKQLDVMNEDIERTRDKMNTLTARFDRYVAKFSTCKMIIILIIELVIAFVTGILLF